MIIAFLILAYLVCGIGTVLLAVSWDKDIRNEELSMGYILVIWPIFLMIGLIFGLGYIMKQFLKKGNK